MAELETQLLLAIREQPDDDAPRLVYADWLTERGDPRGELIAVQCAMARLERDDERRPPLEARDRELRTAHEEAWRGALQALPGFASGYLERGFVRRLAMKEAALGTHLATAVAAAPVLEDVFLSRREDDPGEPAAAPPELARLRGIAYATARYALAGLASGHLDGLASLELQRSIAGPEVIEVIDALVARPLRLRMLDVRLANTQDAPLARLLSWAGVATLERLHAIDSSLGPRAIAQLAAAPALANLRVAWLWDNPMRDDGVRALVTSPHLRALDELHVNRTGGAAALAACTLPALAKLHCGEQDLRGGLATALASARGLAGLAHLTVRGSNRSDAPELDADDARALLSSTALARLRSLDLQQQRLGDAAAAHAFAGARTGLAKLALRYNDLGPAAVRALALNPNLATLVELDLSENPLDAAAAVELAAAPHLRPRKLVLDGTRLGAEGLAALAGSPVLSELRTLELGSCKLTSPAVAALAASPHLTRLLRLHLGYNEAIDDDAATRLVRLPPLATLNLRGTAVTPAGRAALVAAGHHVE